MWSTMANTMVINIIESLLLVFDFILYFNPEHYAIDIAHLHDFQSYYFWNFRPQLVILATSKNFPFVTIMVLLLVVVASAATARFKISWAIIDWYYFLYRLVLRFSFTTASTELVVVIKWITIIEVSTIVTKVKFEFIVALCFTAI